MYGSPRAAASPRASVLLPLPAAPSIATTRGGSSPAPRSRPRARRRAGTNPGKDTSAASIAVHLDRRAGRERGDDERHRHPMVAPRVRGAARQPSSGHDEILPSTAAVPAEVGDPPRRARRAGPTPSTRSSPAPEEPGVGRRVGGHHREDRDLVDHERQLVGGHPGRAARRRRARPTGRRPARRAPRGRRAPRSAPPSAPSPRGSRIRRRVEPDIGDRQLRAASGRPPPRGTRPTTGRPGTRPSNPRCWKARS